MERKQRVYVMVGLPGCGKSTAAKEYVSTGAVIICRDDFRTMINGGQYAYREELESAIKTMADAAVQAALYHDLDVVFDETHHTVQRRLQTINTIRDAMPNAFITAIIFDPTDMEGCIARRIHDSKGLVPETWDGIIRKFADSYEDVSAEEGFDCIHYIPKPYLAEDFLVT